MENFKSFDELFENAIRYGSIEQPKDTAHKGAIRSYYNFGFNEWLSQNKGWKFGDTKAYMKFLTRAYWLEFKQHEDTLKSKSKFEFEEIKKSWQSSSADTKTDKIKAPALGLFCGLINKIGIDRKDDTESATVYCKRICYKFKLPYTDRVRQNYNVNETRKLLKELSEMILPLIDNKTRTSFETYLDSKQPKKQNLYA